MISNHFLLSPPPHSPAAFSYRAEFQTVIFLSHHSLPWLQTIPQLHLTMPLALSALSHPWISSWGHQSSPQPASLSSSFTHLSLHLQNQAAVGYWQVCHLQGKDQILRTFAIFYNLLSSLSAHHPVLILCTVGLFLFTVYLLPTGM